MHPPPLEEAGAASPEAAGAPWFRRLTFWSLLAGLCPLIPVPFLDDWTLEWVRRRLAAETFRAHGREAGVAEVRELTRRPDEGLARGCLRLAVVAPLVKLAVWLVRKAFRAIVFVLLLSDCADRFSATFHEGYLLERAFRLGLLGGGPQPAERLAALRLAIEAACDAVDPRPVLQIARRAFRGSRQLLREAARLLGAVARRKRAGAREGTSPAAGEDAALADEERLLSGLLDRLAAALWHQEGYRAHLEAAFQTAARERGLLASAAAPNDPPEMG